MNRATYEVMTNPNSNGYTGLNDRPGDWVFDIYKMHKKFGVQEWVDVHEELADYAKLKTLLEFRIKTMIKEEYDETVKALEDGDAEEIVDGLIDMCVFAIGTLDIFGIDAQKAWRQIYDANMSKEPGIKPGRPNPWGLPDMVKPEGWMGPSHHGNHGILKEVLNG